jgi:putative FmdB family regulatory protein
MPCYSYICKECDNTFDKLVSKPDPDILQSCPKCGKDAEFCIPQGSRNKVAFRFNYFAPDCE